MGQTDAQFKAFLRFVLDALKETKAETESAKKDEKIDKIIDNIQKSLED